MLMKFFLAQHNFSNGMVVFGMPMRGWARIGEAWQCLAWFGCVRSGLLGHGVALILEGKDEQV